MPEKGIDITLNHNDIIEVRKKTDTKQPGVDWRHVHNTTVYKFKIWELTLLIGLNIGCIYYGTRNLTLEIDSANTQ